MSSHPVQPGGQSSSHAVVPLGPRGTSLDDVIAVARHGARVELTDDALAGMAASRARIDELANAAVPKYGISTGFGALANRHCTEL